MTNEPYTGECKDCYQHVLSPECDGHGICVGEPCPHGKPLEQKNEPTTGELIHQMKNVHRGTGGYDLVSYATKVHSASKAKSARSNG